MTTEIKNETNTFIKQLAVEDPQKLILTEIGTIIQDYISAYVNQNDITEKNKLISGISPFMSSLMYVLTDRINKSAKSIN